MLVVNVVIVLKLKTTFINMKTDIEGKPLSVGDRCLRASKYGQGQRLEFCTIISFREPKDQWDMETEILTDGNSKTGWSKSNRLYRIEEGL